MNDVNGTQVQAEDTSKMYPKLDELDISKLENFFLKIQNLQLQGQKLQADYGTCEKMLVEYQTQLKNFRDSLNEKYGVNLAQCTIGPDGQLIPRAPGVPTQAHQG